MKQVEERVIRETVEKKLENDFDDDLGGIDDTDNIELEAEYAEWKVRELKRFLRKRELLEAEEKEQDERRRRENMTEEERQAEIDAEEKESSKSKDDVKSKQKYYHKGAFYQDQEILKRDYSQPVEEF